MDHSKRIAHSSLVPASRFAWMAGALSTAAQPARLAVGLVVALLVFVPGLTWDAAVGARIDPPGLLAEPWDDIEQAEAQHTLRTIASKLVPELDFESARVPAGDLVAALDARAAELGADPQAPRYASAARAARELLPLGSFRAIVNAESAAAGAAVDGVLSASPRAIVDGVRAAFVTAPVALVARDPVFAAVLALWMAIVGGVGLGALGRMEAVQVAGRTPLDARGAFAFAAERWSSVALSWGVPLAFAAVLVLACAAFGALFRTDAGSWLGGVLYVLPLSVGALAGLMLLVAALGAPLSPAGVACDGLESLDASQRGAIYFLARPLLWVLALAAAVAIGAIGITFLRIAGWAISSVPAFAVELGSADRAPSAALTVVPGAMELPHGGPALAVWAWVHLLGLTVVGACVSLAAGLVVRTYLLLREACDGQPVDEVWPYDRPADADHEVPAPIR